MSKLPKKERKNILYLSPSRCFYGAEKCLFELIKYLDKEKFTSHVIADAGCNYRKEFTKIEVDFTELKFVIPTRIRNLLLMARANWRLIRFVYIHKIDLVHINFEIKCDESLIVFFIFLKIMRIPWVYHLRSPTIFYAYKRLIMLNGKVISVSESIRKQYLMKRRSDFITRPSIDKVVTIYDGKDLSAFLTDNNAENLKTEFNLKGEKIVGIVGALDARKRQDLFLLIAQEIKKQIHQVKFFIIGDLYTNSPKEIAYKERIMKITQELGLKDDVIFTGYRDDVNLFIRLMDVFVLTSKRDPFPGTIIEAMASARTVVASAVDGVVEQVENGETGFLINSDDPKEYADKIVLLLNDDKTRNEMAKKARKRAIELYSIDRHVENIEDFYDKLFKSKY
ncbi:MAG: glycosyltransferase family 4 protein [Nanoarchaeota archaeon]